MPATRKRQLPYRVSSLDVLVAAVAARIDQLHVPDLRQVGPDLAAARPVRVAATFALAVQAGQAVHVARAPLAAAGQLAWLERLRIRV